MAIVALLMALIHGVTASAADTWSVNPSDYRYDMSLYLDVVFGTGEKLDYTQFDVAAFVGDECRGVAEILSLPDGNSCLYLRARSNRESGESMSFRYRNRSTGEVKSIEGADFSFSSNARLGYPSSPHVVKIVIYHDVDITAGEGGTVNTAGGRLAEGTTLSLSATPAEGHRFVQWSDGVTDNPRSITVGKEDITLSAEFAIISYHLTYTLDGASYKEADVPYGTALTPEPDPVKEGYTFSGWQNLPETMPAHDVEVTGTFSINTYNAVFKIGDDIIETKRIVYGEAVVAPEAPAKEGHTFAGWQDVPATMPAHDIVVMGSYTVDKYKLNYKVDGQDYKSVEVEYGTTITPEAAPVKEGYTFSGWQNLPETMPAHDVEVTGTFSINTYNAVFKIGDDIIETKRIVYGEAVVAPEAPAKEGHTFAGWQDVPATMPAHDIVVMGSYTVNKYKLNYKVDGQDYKSVEVEYGTAITPEAAPVKEGYTFSGWQNLPETMPAHDVEVTGTFSINSYRLTVYLDNEVYMDEVLEYGAAINVPDPEVPSDRKFDGWDMEIPKTMPAHDVIVHGTTTIVSGLQAIFADGNMRVTICSMNGTLLFRNTTVKDAARNLKPGMYIVNGRKVMVK